MPIKTFNITSNYESIPDEEDVTPIDRSIAKKAKKTTKYVICGVTLLIIVVIALYFGLNYASVESSDVSIYQTSLQESPNRGLRRLKLSDMTTAGASVKSFSFGNTKCVQSSTSTTAGFQCSHLPLSAADLSVDTSRKYQEIIGFGGAFTEASAINFYSLPDKVQEQVIDLYFGEGGISLTLGRVHINSCDFSPRSYSFDDIEGDYDLQFFDSEVTHDNKKILPMIREAMAASKLPIKLLASPWSPPAWMKVPVDGEQSMTGSSYPNGLKNDSKTKLAWARYIAKFVEAYEAKGAPIWAVTPQNEPEFPAPWEACAYNASFEHDFISDFLGPVLKSSFPDVLLLGFDHNKDHLESWTRTLMFGDAGKYLDGMAFHWYGGLDRMTDGTYGYEAVNASHHMVPDKIMLNTEGCSCPGVKLGDWLRAERVGHDIMYDLNNYASGWIDWNLLVDYYGGPNHLGNLCDASIIKSKDSSHIILQPKYFYMGHFSKFVLPGSVRVHSKIVGNFRFEKVDPNVQAGLELGMYSCERSTRQMWEIEPETKQLKLKMPVLIDGGKSGHIELCVVQGALDRPVLKLADCSLIDSSVQASAPSAEDKLHIDYTQAENHQKNEAEFGDLHHDAASRALFTAEDVKPQGQRKIEVSDKSFNSVVPFLEVSLSDDGFLFDHRSGMCVGLKGDVREPGALLELAPCANSSKKKDAAHQLFSYDAHTGELLTKKIDGGLCMTAGWPFLSAAAFTNSANKETTIIVMNEATLPTSIALSDARKSTTLGFAIFGRSIQTIVYKS